MNDPNMIAAFIGALTSLIVASVTSLFAWLRWRKDVSIQLEQIRDEITSELIRQRVEPYTVLMKALEPMSSLHRQKIEANPHIINSFSDVFQDALYGPVGTLASHDTRELIIYARRASKAFVEKTIEYEDWLVSVYAVTLSLRSDLGIVQPDWDNEIDKLRRLESSDGNPNFAERGQSSIRWVEPERMREILRTSVPKTLQE